MELLFEDSDPGAISDGSVGDTEPDVPVLDKSDSDTTVLEVSESSESDE